MVIMNNGERRSVDVNLKRRTINKQVKSISDEMYEIA